ncbi:MAG: DNA gyrase inhibitor YacG [Geminicoccales bacterium]
MQKDRPFCSARCRDIDLGRWFGEIYTLPAAEPGYDADDTPDTRTRDDG